jgi:hypothetical protein
VNLIERLNQIAEHDWRVSLLGHASDTAVEAVARIAELEAEAASHRQLEEMILQAKAARIADLEAERDQAERERFRFGALNKAELEAETSRLKAENHFAGSLTLANQNRVAELEAEVRSLNIALADTISGKNHDIAELEAERDKWKAAAEAHFTKSVL